MRLHRLNNNKYCYWIYPYSIRNASIKANSAIASHSENANIASVNSSPLSEGFLETPNIRAPNTNPAPIAPPLSPIVANPAPINLADIIILQRLNP